MTRTTVLEGEPLALTDEELEEVLAHYRFHAEASELTEKCTHLLYTRQTESLRRPRIEVVEGDESVTVYLDEVDGHDYTVAFERERAEYRERGVADIDEFVHDGLRLLGVGMDALYMDGARLCGFYRADAPYANVEGEEWEQFREEHIIQETVRVTDGTVTERRCVCGSLDVHDRTHGRDVPPWQASHEFDLWTREWPPSGSAGTE